MRAEYKEDFSWKMAHATQKVELLAFWVGNCLRKQNLW
jgi:hypothetical protein